MHDTANRIPWKTLELKECVICGSNGIKPHFKGSKMNLPMTFSRCGNCTAVFQNPRPHKESLAVIFNDQKLFGGHYKNTNLDDTVLYYDYSAYEEALSRNARSHLKKMSRYVPPPARLLEIGGATGWFMKAARDFGYEVEGLDISSTLAGEVQRRYGIGVRVSPIEEATFPDHSFDIICSFGGIECWMDPHQGLANVFRMLENNGIFFFNYIDTDTLLARLKGRKYYQYNPCTNHLFNQHTIHYLLELHGFKILSERMPMTRISLGPLFHFLQWRHLFKLSILLKLDRFVFILPNIQAKTVVAVKSKKIRAMP